MMSEVCKCFDETLERVKWHALDQIPGNATEVKIDWQGRAFMLDGGDHSPVNPKVSIRYRGMEKDGTPKSSMTTDSVTILASHCCFCGRAYNKEQE